jgi:hypothetical protein
VHCAVHAKGKTALEVAGEIARAASAAVPERIEDFAPALQEVLRDPGGPGRPRARRRFNVIIGALGEAVSPEQAREIARKVILPLAETFADDGARVVAGTRRTDGGGDLLRAFEDAGHAVDLDTPEYFEDEDLAGYALACLQVDSGERPGSPSPYADAEAARPLAEAIARAADGNFLIGGLVARTRGLYDRQAADPARLRPVRSVRDALEEYLKRLPGIERISAWRLLTALAFAEDSGLTVGLWKLAVEALPPGGPDEDWPVQVQARRLDAFARSGRPRDRVPREPGPGPVPGAVGGRPPQQRDPGLGRPRRPRARGVRGARRKPDPPGHWRPRRDGPAVGPRHRQVPAHRSRPPRRPGSGTRGRLARDRPHRRSTPHHDRPGRARAPAACMTGTPPSARPAGRPRNPPAASASRFPAPAEPDIMRARRPYRNPCAPRSDSALGAPRPPGDHQARRT